MSIVQWQGVYPAILTPFKKDDSIDFEMYQINMKAQLDAGIDGIVLGGSLGEASTLTNSEKTALLIYTKELVQEKVPVIMNIAEQSTKAAMAAANEAETNGADGLMLLPPMRYKADDRETLEYFKSVAASTSLPIMIYNNPIDYKILATLDMFEEMAPLPNIQAVKESTRDITNITRMVNRFGDRFKIMGGVDTLSYESLCAVAIYKLVKAGYYKEALKIYRWFLPVLELDIHPKLVQYIKLAATQTGIGTEYVRAPRLTIEGEELKQILAIINHAIETRPVLPDYLNLQPVENVQWA
jgi:4-hydroxy-tetrahydrodipicolinate synthase